MNFYLNAVDSILRVGDDKESVGIILCSDHHDTTATLALARIQSPIAVSTWKSIEGVNPEDKADLEELEDVRQKLIERVNRRLPEMREAQKRK
jgi:hypothetical protein